MDLKNLVIESLIQKPKNQNVHSSTKTNCSIRLENLGVEKNRRIKINDIRKKNSTENFWSHIR